MDARARRLAYRAAAIIRDHGAEGQELFQFAAEHPITMKLILARLKKDNDEIALPPIAPLLAPGDPE